MANASVASLSSGKQLSRPRVLIVDDSAVARAVMARAIEADGRFVVAGAVAEAGAARTALAAARVDAILLDIALPGIDGLTALPDLIAASSDARILVVSSSCGEGAAATVQALALGAADTLVKPGAGTSFAQFADALVEKLARLTEQTGEPESVSVPVVASGVADAFDVVAIGASTGGIHALSQVLRALPAEFDTPILITQHLPASFMPYFAAQVAVLGSRPCDVAVDRLRIRRGRIVVAPGDAHMRCVSLRGGGCAIRLTADPAPSGCLPSVDPMFDAVADVFGARALAVVLSGMGRDGAEGARRIADAGGCVVAQDQSSSVVWGMPGAVVAGGVAATVLPPDAIGRLIAARRRPS